MTVCTLAFDSFLVLHFPFIPSVSPSDLLSDLSDVKCMCTSASTLPHKIDLFHLKTQKASKYHDGKLAFLPSLQDPNAFPTNKNDLVYEKEESIFVFPTGSCQFNNILSTNLQTTHLPVSTGNEMPGRNDRRNIKGYLRWESAVFLFTTPVQKKLGHCVQCE